MVLMAASIAAWLWTIAIVREQPVLPEAGLIAYGCSFVTFDIAALRL